eukprot:sb/3473761/
MVAIDNAEFYDDVWGKISSLIRSYGNVLSYEATYSLTHDSFRFPVTLPDQIAPIITGIDRGYNGNPVRIEIGYFWENEGDNRRGLGTHPHLLTVADIIQKDIVRMIKPSRTISVISLAFIRVLVFKLDEVEVDEDYDICGCEMCSI